MLRRHVIGASVSIVLVTILAGVAIPETCHLSGTAIKEAISQPKQWVAFEANITVTVPGKSATHGRFIRAADGSDRLETGPDANTVLVISINNIQQRMHYLRQPAGWFSYSLDLPQEGWHPGLFSYSTDMSGLSKLPGMVFVDKDSQLMAVTATSEPAKGFSSFEAYRYVTSRGMSSVLVPDLNFFAVLRQDLLTGKRIAYFNIRTGIEPATSLFLPPSGIQIARVAPPAVGHSGHNHDLPAPVKTP